MKKSVNTKTICFDDILLLPQSGSVKSRNDVGLSMSLGVDSRPRSRLLLQTPIIAAPMDTVCEKEMALALYRLGGLGILHRYMSPENVVKQSKWLYDQECKLFGVSVSTAQTQDELYLKTLRLSGARVFCIDTANGHSTMTTEAVRRARNVLGQEAHIMAGNVSTREGYERLIESGADSVRVGIGGGSACTTRIVSGHGAPTLWSVMECEESAEKGGIVADGGIRNTGDMVKAFAAGANAVMVGRLLAGHDESPQITDDEGNLVYRGMASGAAQKDWRGGFKSEEGVAGAIKLEGPVFKTVESIRYGIGSGCSYTGVQRLSELKNAAKYVEVSPLCAAESRPRV